MTKILPSILTSDFTHVDDDLKLFEKLELNEIHMDVMDGCYVPAITFGPKFISDLKSHNSSLMFDTHLMIVNPINHISDFIKAGSDSITVHFENEKTSALIKMRKITKDADVKFGLALSPNVNVKKLEKVLKKVDVDIILIMSVMPGAGGQSFIEETLDSALYLKKLKEKNDYHYTLAIDGGINEDNFKKVKDAGCERVVIGSSLYKNGEIEDNVNRFKELDK